MVDGMEAMTPPGEPVDGFAMEDGLGTSGRGGSGVAGRMMVGGTAPMAASPTISNAPSIRPCPVQSAGDANDVIRNPGIFSSTGDHIGVKASPKDD